MVMAPLSSDLKKKKKESTWAVCSVRWLCGDRWLLPLLPLGWGDGLTLGIACPNWGIEDKEKVSDYRASWGLGLGNIFHFSSASVFSHRMVWISTVGPCRHFGPYGQSKPFKGHWALTYILFNLLWAWWEANWCWVHVLQCAFSPSLCNLKTDVCSASWSVSVTWESSIGPPL